jgi:cyclopropane-fatty-acyl-phospholipid synthase
MTLPATEIDSQAVRNGLSFLQSLLGELRPRDFAVRLWDGTIWDADPAGTARFTLVLRHPAALRRMLFPPNQLNLGEAYIYEDFDIEGDIIAAFTLGDFLCNQHWGLLEKVRFGRYLLDFPPGPRLRSGERGARLHGSRHSRRRDRQAITYHYNVSNDFYRLWLDERMVYSCAYFASPDEDLGRAQERKLDYICRKLRLQRGEYLLDIGCGWGGLVLHAAQHYGVEALGITLSEPQAELASERISRAGLAGRCRVEVRDYRELEDDGSYDKLVSVGMFEHVGGARLGGYFDRAFRLLRSGGVFLNHGIASSLSQPEPAGPSFVEHYVFPDGELLPVSETLNAAETSGFEVRDLESLREHYALTLEKWVQRLEGAHEEARRLTDETTYRIWRLYMAGSAHGFRTGRLNVYQALLAKPAGGKSGLPLSRADWYE